MPVRDHQVVERLGCFILAFGLYDIFGARIFDPSARDFLVFPSQGQFDIIGGQGCRIHFVAVDPDAHLAGPAAAHGHRSDPGDLFNVALQDFIGIMRQVLDGPVSPDRDPDDGLVLGADLLDHRRFRVLRGAGS